MRQWRKDRMEIVLQRLEDLDRDLEELESVLANAPPGAPRLSAETKTKVQELYSALKSKLSTADKENYESKMGAPNELESFWFPVIRTVLHQELSERANSANKDKLFVCMVEARSTVGAALRDVRAVLSKAGQ